MSDDNFDPVWGHGDKDQLNAACERERDAALASKTDLESFRGLHNALTRNGPLTVDRLLEVATNKGIQTSRDEINAILTKYDANNNGVSELAEFSAWWSNATDGLSVLLRNALSEAVLAPGQCEQWRRGNCLRVDATAGKVDDAFEPRSGIFVTLVPSSEANLREAAGTAGVDTAGRVPQAVAAAKLTLKDSASDEDVQQLIDLINMVSDEMTSADPSAAPFKIVLTKVHEDGRRLLKVQGTALNVPKDPSKMVNHFAMLAGLKDQALFRRFMFGIEFGVDGERVLAPMPEGALPELLENFRLTAQFEYDDALLKLLTVLALQPDGLDEDSIMKLLAVTFIGRGARSVHLTSNFRSYKEVIDSLIDNIAKVPFAKRPAKSRDELYKQAMASALIRQRLEAVTSFTQVRSTLIHAVPVLEKLYGDVPEPQMVHVIGTKDSGKQALIEKMGGVANGSYFNKQRMFFDRKPGKQYRMFIENDGIVQDPMGDPIIIACIDASSPESLAESQKLVSMHITGGKDLGPDNFLLVITKTGSTGSVDDVRKTLAQIMGDCAPGEEDEDVLMKIVHFDSSSVPSVVTEALDDKLSEGEDYPDDSAAAAAEDDDDDDDDDDEGGMAAIAKKVMQGVTKCVAGVHEVEVTNNIVSAHIMIENLPFGNVLAETSLEKIRRNRMEFMCRFMSIQEIEVGDVAELADAWAVEEEESAGAKKPQKSSATRGRRNSDRLIESGDSDSSDY